jgi:DNA-binding NtrC family response regulator
MFASQFVPEHLKRKGTLVDELFQQVRDAHLAIEPLRHRADDIPLLAEKFVEQICHEHGKEIRDLSDDAIDALKQFNWPENVSQLRDMIYLAVMRTKPQPIDETVLPEPVGRRATQAPKVSIPEEGVEFYEVVSELERALVGSALKITAGNQRRAAQLLRLKETTFAAMRKRLGLR